MRSTSAAMCPCSSAPVTAAATAPQWEWPITTNSGVSRCSTPYSSDPISSSPQTFPATRTTKRSPMPCPKMISGGTRESEQLRTLARGCCPCAAVAATRSASRRGCRFSPARNRVFPALSCSSVSSGAAPGSTDAGERRPRRPGPGRPAARRVVCLHNLTAPFPGDGTIPIQPGNSMRGTAAGKSVPGNGGCRRRLILGATAATGARGSCQVPHQRPGRAAKIRTCRPAMTRRLTIVVLAGNGATVSSVRKCVQGRSAERRLMRR